MTFKEMPYKRLTYAELECRYLELIDECKKASNIEEIRKVMEKKHLLDSDMTQMSLCYVRHDMDVNDSFYAAEQEYYDEIGPMLTELDNRFQKILLEESHREAAKEILGPQVMAMMENAVRGFNESIIELAQEENVLTGRHNNLTSVGTVKWNGEEIKRSLMNGYTQSTDRETRRKAYQGQTNCGGNALL